MFQPHVPLVHGLLVLTVVMALQLALLSLTNGSERAEDESEPVLMVEDGKVVDRALGAGRLSRRELMMRLKQQSIGDVD